MTERILTNAIEIPISKKKIVLVFLACLLFLGASLWLLLGVEGDGSSIMRSQYVIKPVGILGLTFSLFGIYMFIQKIFGKSQGLIVSDEGITMLYTRSNKPIFVPWGDIDHIRELNIHSTKIIDLQLKDPQSYIDNASDGITRKTMQFNYNNFGSVMSITANVLQCSHDELKSLLEKKLGQYLIGKTKEDEE